VQLLDGGSRLHFSGQLGESCGESSQKILQPRPSNLSPSELMRSERPADGQSYMFATSSKLACPAATSARMPYSFVSIAGTAAAGAIVLLLYALIQGRITKSYTRRSPKASTSSAYKTTYRAQGIPATFSRGSTREVLQRLLE
jgi:hypothetical protein